MSTSSTTNRPRVTFFVRNHTTGVDPQKRRVLGRLRELAGDGRVTDLEVQSWPARIEIEDAWTDREARLLDTVRQFDRWAEDADVSVEPFFGTRADTHLATDEERTARVLPVMAIAVYDGTSVVDTVAPHMTPNGPYTVYDCLADLETSTADADEPADVARADPSPRF